MPVATQSPHPLLPFPRTCLRCGGHDCERAQRPHDPTARCPAEMTEQLRHLAGLDRK